MSRAVLAPFETYQKARVTFVQTVAELATRPQNIEALQSAGKNSPHIRRSDESPQALATGQRAEYLVVSCPRSWQTRELL